MLKVLAIGHLGQDATVNNVNGKSVINFSVAHTEKFKDNQGNQQEKTTWLSCAKWEDGNAAVAQYLKKGTQVYIEGMPSVKSFQKQDGSTGTAFEVRVFQLQLLSSAQGQQQQPQHAPAAPQPPQYDQRPQYQQPQQGYQQYQQQPQQQPGYGPAPAPSMQQGGNTGYPPPPPPAQGQQGNMFQTPPPPAGQPQQQFGQQPYQAPNNAAGQPAPDLPF